MSIEAVGAQRPYADLTSSEADQAPEAKPSAGLGSGAELSAEFSGDPHAQIAAMLLKHAHDRRALSKQMRQSEERSLRETEKKEVDLMKQAAQKEHGASLMRAAGQIATGVAQAGAGFATMGTKDPQVMSQKMGAPMGVAQVLSAGCEISAAGSSFKAGELRADATEASSKARQVARRMEDLRADEGAAADLADKALDHIEKAKEAEAQAYRAALFRG
ncbi:MAG: hypothetical protein KIT72_06930 [Polyangiaceae bacterium]|nr:hypothetical protein [Polyangiaceae bacterium]MCW5790138.1 hypothetical protein [Polyangiaceae bacterium]